MANDGKTEKIVQQVERNFEEQVAFLSKLITFKTIAGQEGDAQRFYAEKSREQGMSVEMLQPDPAILRSHPSFYDAGVDYTGRPNIIARAGEKGSGSSLILNGHMDVVSPEPVEDWSFDPWGGAVDKGRLYGRGANDMKSGLCANLFALKALLDCGFQTSGEVILESVIEEEPGGSGGTLACFVQGVTADAMVVTEPSRETLAITHPGILHFRVNVSGRSAHAGFSHTGVNAIVKMMPIVKALDELDRHRAETLSHPLVERITNRSCNLCIGTMHAGDWVSTVAGKASLACRIGFVPGETGKEVKAQVEDTVYAAVKDDDWFIEHPAEVEWYNWATEPWNEPEDSVLVKSFIESSRKIMENSPTIVGAPGAMDTRFAPLFDTAAICFGPQGGNEHGIDEYVELDSVKKVTKILALFISDWCGLLD